jgi:general secretion pathway protein D
LIPRSRVNWGCALAAGAGAVWVLASAGCSPYSSYYHEGQKAELRKDYDQAVIDYGKALEHTPQNSKYKISEKLAREKAGQQHLARGRELVAEGRLDEAAGEFTRGYKIDPTNETAKQELARVLTKQAASKQERSKALQEALKPQEAAAAPTGTILKPFSQEPITHFRLSADAPRVFEALGKLADLNVVFSYDFQQQPRKVTLDLTNVKIEDALKAAAYESHAFWTPISHNTILIVPDTPTARREYEQDVVRVFHLSNPLAAADRTQITTALRQVLQLTRIIDNPNANSIIIRDTPEKVAAAEQIIRSLDLGKAEILVDVSIIEMDRTRMTQLGIVPINPSTGAAGLSILFGPNPNSTGSSTGGSGTTVSGIFGLGSPLGWDNFAVTLPALQANAVLGDSTTHILQSPTLRATDGMIAKLTIGSRIPYATGSFLPSLTGVSGTTGTSLLASTQFQYQDVGVKLEITPHLTQTGEIAMHAKVEISAEGAPVTIAGVQQPTFTQRNVEHDIQLQEGEVSVLGGLTEQDITNAVQGIPGLGDIPGLKYLFSGTSKTTTDNEILIMLDPHVVRLPEIAPETAATVSGEAGGAPLPPPGLGGPQ